MTAIRKAIIVGLVAAAVIGTLALRPDDTPIAQTPVEAGTPGTSVPRLLELGSVTCVPCKAMEKVLEALRHEYAGQLQVDFIDVSKNPDAGHAHGISMIPTQILFAPDGTEIFRHEGFFAKKDIVRQFSELGYPLSSKAPPEATANDSAWSISTMFLAVSRAIEGRGWFAVGAAFVWGILSVLLSPCHLASIPLIVGFIDEQGRMSTRRACFISTCFSFGILLTIALVGAITAAAGRMAGDIGPAGNILVSVVFLVVGLHLLEVIPAPWAGPGQPGVTKKGALAAFLLGLVFGLALGPCTFAYMAPLLAVTFQAGAEYTAFGVLLLMAYGIGHCSVIVLAGTSAEMVQRYLDWNEASRGTRIAKSVCGALVTAGGLYMLWKL